MPPGLSEPSTHPGWSHGGTRGFLCDQLLGDRARDGQADRQAKGLALGGGVDTRKVLRRKMPPSVTLFCYRVGSVTGVGGDLGSRAEMMIYLFFSESPESNKTLVIK